MCRKILYVQPSALSSEPQWALNPATVPHQQSKPSFDGNPAFYMVLPRKIQRSGVTSDASRPSSRWAVQDPLWHARRPKTTHHLSKTGLVPPTAPLAVRPLGVRADPAEDHWILQHPIRIENLLNSPLKAHARADYLARPSSLAAPGCLAFHLSHLRPTAIASPVIFHPAIATSHLGFVLSCWMPNIRRSCLPPSTCANPVPVDFSLRICTPTAGNNDGERIRTLRMRTQTATTMGAGTEAEPESRGANGKWKMGGGRKCAPAVRVRARARGGKCAIHHASLVSGRFHAHRSCPRAYQHVSRRLPLPWVRSALPLTSSLSVFSPTDSEPAHPDLEVKTGSPTPAGS
ncbi:hypothetical protein B0H19DRAFT_1082479 [Mycena capillaripes]|nr:hypothetical protein B0H19DRAFT_1082479 [Mycena capillaripes]